MTSRSRVALAACLLAAGCSRGGGPAGPAGPRPVLVRGSPAASRDMPIEVRAVGRIVSNQSVAVRPQVGGVITAVHFAEGQAVNKGDLLVEIDRRPFEAQLAEARARLAQDRARLESARADASRYAELVKKEFVTQQQHEQARAAAATAEAAVAGDEAAVANALLNLSWCTVRAPATGRTGRLLVHAGNLVTANAATPIVTLEQVKPVHAAFSIPERHLPALRDWRKAPPPVRVEAAGGAPAVTGTLDFVDNAVDAATGTILLKARLANEDEALVPGQVVDVRLRVAERKGAVVVPSSAVSQGQQGDYAFVVADGKAQLRAVTVDQAGEAEVIVARGIAPGEVVIVEGQLKLRPGSAVELVDAARTAPGTPGT